MRFRCPLLKLGMPAVHRFLVHPRNPQHFYPHLFIHVIHCSMPLMRSQTSQHARKKPPPGLKNQDLIANLIHSVLDEPRVGLIFRSEDSSDIVKRKARLAEAADPLKAFHIVVDVHTIPR